MRFFLFTIAGGESGSGAFTKSVMDRLAMMVWPIFGVLVCIASRQAALLLIDIADTLIFDSNHKKRE